jgi:hypothetical protein
MINNELHKKPVALDRVMHRNLRLRTDVNPLKAVAQLNAAFLTAAEFGDACKEYPILFLRAGTHANGKPQVAPVAVMGLTPGENLFIEKRENGDLGWRGRYTPAMLRAYPFTMAQVEQDRWAVCIDDAWAGWSREEGRELFDDKGEPTPFLAEMRGFVEQLEAEIERTRAAGERLLELGLLQDKRFDATLPDGSPLSVDGFLGVNEERLNQLTDAEIVELHRNGLLGVIATHQVSLGNMRALIERRLVQNTETINIKVQ